MYTSYFPPSFHMTTMVLENKKQQQINRNDLDSFAQSNSECMHQMWKTMNYESLQRAPPEEKENTST